MAFVDEFGHIGPYISRSDARYNISPVFGLAGYVIPHEHARSFATFFIQLKQHVFQSDISRVGAHPATWEKKGKEFLTRKNISQYPNLRNAIFRVLNELRKRDGKIVYYGRVKYQTPQDSNANGLYKTVLTKTIRSIDDYCCQRKEYFVMIMDQHSDRIRLLEAASKTMFSSEAPARCLVEPPFQVESHLYQTIQAADWLATLVGRIHAYRTSPSECSDWEWANLYFGKLIDRLSTHCSIWRPSAQQRKLRLVLT